MGPTRSKKKKTNPLLKFLSYFWDPIPWMIEATVILSAVARHWPDFGIILVLLLTNAVVGFWEEHAADNAIEALKAKLAVKARVICDGKWGNPAAREFVPGDAIRMRLGDIVPTDARLLDGDPMSVDQSALTGESLPVERKPGNAVFSGSIIRRGESSALVYATGANTYFGKTAELVQDAHTVSHFQKAVLKIGNYLIMLAVVLVATIIIVAIYRDDPILTTLQFALVLTVAAIPVAMPTVLSVTMAVGARLFAKKEAIVSRLLAIEELAGVDILCADKTGTLTQNKPTLGNPVRRHPPGAQGGWLGHGPQHYRPAQDDENGHHQGVDFIDKYVFPDGEIPTSGGWSTEWLASTWKSWTWKTSASTTPRPSSTGSGAWRNAKRRPSPWSARNAIASGRSIWQHRPTPSSATDPPCIRSWWSSRNSSASRHALGASLPVYGP